MWDSLLSILAVFASLPPKSLQSPSNGDYAPPGSKTAPILSVVQVTPSIKVPELTNCTVILMEHTFAFSYGKPFISEIPLMPFRV
jgi:Peptide N-acetyl-beta-D-glucosaminyl asparaginase amidase A